MDTTVADPLIGRLLDGRYRVVSKVARGGMATVYEGVDTRLERPVALKVMHAGLAEDQAFVTRFIREARSAARLSDPNVVAVYDQGQDGGTVFLAMEHVRGRTLRDLIRERGRLSPRQALDVLEPVLSALSAAHRAGLVHRDVKPENVLLAEDGRVKVADFGLARSALASGTSSSTQGVVMGTVAYLSPEQVERGAADPRSDVYSAGILLFEMLTGSPPYVGDTPMSVAYQHVTSDVPAPSSLVPGLAAGLDDLVLRATDRKPAGRPADAGAFAAQVRAVRGALPGGPRALAPSDIDLSDTLVAGLPGLPGAADAVGIAALTAVDAHHTSVLAPPTPMLPGRGVKRPTSPVVAGPSEIPSAANRNTRRRGAVIGLVLLLILAIGLGVGAWYLGAGRWATTPSVVGLSRTAAEVRIEAAGLKFSIGPAQHSETVRAGYVLSTDPAPAGRVLKGGTVTLVLSSGPQRFAVPNVLGKTLSAATAALAAQHLAVGSQTSTYSDTVKAGEIIATSPVAGTALKSNTPVRLVVSRGVAPATVPVLTGMTLSAAQAAAARARVTLDSSAAGQYSTTVAKGSVISQGTPAGTLVPRGATVSVVISLGPPLVTVPNVFKMDKNRAKKILQAAGFTVVFTEPFGVTPFNQVYSQDPAGGTQAPLGSTIHLGIV